MSGAPGNPKTQSEGELKAARTMNTVATIGAVHAAHASAAKDFPKYARADRKAKQAAAKVVPTGVRRRIAAVGGKGGHVGGKAGAAIGAGWLGFHGAEFAGDIMARRTINNALDAKRQEKKNGPVVKGIPAQVTFGKSDVSVDGVGTSLDAPVAKGRNRQQDRRSGAAMAVAGAGASMYGADRVIARNHYPKRPTGSLARDVTDLVRGKETYVATPHARQSYSYRKLAVPEPNVETHAKLTPKLAWQRAARGRKAALGVGAMAAGGALTANGIERLTGTGRKPKKAVSKTYRRFDPEADRQRRIGAAQGALAGVSVVTGDRASRSLTTEVSNRGARVPGVALRRGASKKKALAYGAASVASGLGAVAAHRHGVSQRNQPWT